jgi:hypothetical protein
VLLYPQARPGAYDYTNTGNKRRGLPPIPALDTDDRERALSYAQELAAERYVVAAVRDEAGEELAAFGAAPKQIPVALQRRRQASVAAARARVAPPPVQALVTPPEPNGGHSSSDPTTVNRWLRAGAFQGVYGRLPGGERLRIMSTRTVKGKLYARAQSTGRWVPITHAERE